MVLTISLSIFALLNINYLVMHSSDSLFYCVFYDNRKQQAVLTPDGLRLCRLLCCTDFAYFLHLGISVCILAVFHDFKNDLFDDTDISLDNALVQARSNAKELLDSLK